MPLDGRVAKYYEEEAKRRMSEGGKTAGKGRPQQGKENLPYPIDAGQAHDKAGRDFASVCQRWDCILEMPWSCSLVTSCGADTTHGDLCGELPREPD